MSQEAQNQDFQSPPRYTQTMKENGSWVNVTLTKVDQDGTQTQVSFIAKKYEKSKL